jgi:flagellar hook-length control protein FliK
MAVPEKTGKADKDPDEPKPQLVTHEGQGDNDEIASEGPSISVPLDAEAAARGANTKPDPAVAISEGSIQPNTFRVGRSDPKPHPPGSEPPAKQDPALHVVAGAEKPVSPHNTPVLTRGGPTPDKQAWAAGKEQPVDGARVTAPIAPSEVALENEKQSLLQPEIKNNRSVMRPVQGQDGPSAVTDMVHPKAALSRVMPQEGQTASPAWPTVPQAPKVEPGEQARSKTAQAATVKTAPNIATPSAASVGGTAPQVMSNPTPARPSSDRAAPEVLASKESVTDRPVLQHTTISERAATPPPLITPALGHGSLATPPPSLGAPVPTLTTDPGEDHRRVFDPAPPDIRFSAEAVSRPGIQTSHVSQTPDLPRHIAHQMAEAVHRNGGDRGVDLLLNPAELGRVRISLSPGEAGMTVQILADRPETLDLIRRHIDLLAQDFQSLGYEATDFAFAQHQDNARSGTSQNSPHPTENLDAEASEMAEHPGTSILTDRVDIRL